MREEATARREEYSRHIHILVPSLWHLVPLPDDITEENKRNLRLSELFTSHHGMCVCAQINSPRVETYISSLSQVFQL